MTINVTGVTTNEIDIRKLASENEQTAEVIDFDYFFDEVLQGYEDGSGPSLLPADDGIARSVIPAGTGAFRDFSYLAPDIPEFDKSACVGCMTCVNECPDTAILGKVVDDTILQQNLSCKQLGV